MLVLEIALKTKTHPVRRQNGKRATPGRTKPSDTLAGRSLQDLAREAGARVFDPNAFAGIVPPGEDIGEFVEEIYRART